ncbi:hypothetical protein C6946_31605 [Burkholderia thailandensis]|nr:hypothetical protein C6946_31605 [Burkholderia thailandensis]
MASGDGSGKHEGPASITPFPLRAIIVQRTQPRETGKPPSFGGRRIRACAAGDGFTAAIRANTRSSNAARTGAQSCD